MGVSRLYTVCLFCYTDLILSQSCALSVVDSTIRAVFLQNFRLSGGPNGRIVRGEELVQINLTSCQRISAKEPFAEQVSPLSRIKNELTRPLRVRRSMST